MKDLPTVTKIRSNFPQFSDETLYPDSVIQRYLNLATIFLKNKHYSDLYGELVGLFVAHNLSLYSSDMESSESGGSGGSQTGVASSKSVDKVSISYDNSATVNADAGVFNLTRYGQEFWWLFEMFGAGGRQL